MKKNGITVINGRARLAGKGRLSITGKDAETFIAAKHIVLATGARARTLPGLDAHVDSVWYYREALRPSRLPKSMLVVGAGAIGIEFASRSEEGLVGKECVCTVRSRWSAYH